MAKYRQVHTHIWKDGWFLELDPAYKLFFIYLFTNERASISGIYELPKRVMAFESGLTFTEIDEAFEIFQDAGKAYRDDDIVLVVNLRKYHETKSPKVQTAIASDIDAIKDCKLKGIYAEIYGMDRVSIPSNSISSSSSISSKNSDEPKKVGGVTYEHEPKNTPCANHDELRQDMVSQLSGVVKTVFTIGYNEAEFEQVADALIERGVKPDDVPGFKAWWSNNGHYSGPPALKSLVGHWGEYSQPGEPAKEWYDDAILE